MLTTTPEEVLMGDGFVKVPQWLVGRVSMTALGVYVNIAGRANGEREAWPSRARIAADTDTSVSTVARAIAELVDAGAIQRIVRGGGHSNVYRVIGDTLGGSRVTRTYEQDSRNQIATTTDVVVASSSVVHPFDEFWTIYPRRVGKKAARSAFARAVATHGTSIDAILAGARRYRDDPNREPEFTAHPTTWLNQGRWDDDPLPQRRGPRGKNDDVMDDLERIAKGERSHGAFASGPDR